MEELLMEWDVSQDTIKVFLENKIDTSCLDRDGLGEDELRILIPDSKLRDRIKFKQGYKKYKEDMETLHSNTDSLSTDTLSLSSCELFMDDTTSKTEKKHNNTKLTLQDILGENTQGRLALQAIKSKKLNSSSRNNLVHAIVEYYIKTFQKMIKVDFEAIATEIVELCPTECKETYYVPSRTLGHKNNMPAKGKLVDRYYNQIRTLRRSGVLPQKRKFTECSESESETTTDTDTDEQWLKFNRDPWPLVEEKWEKTCTLRKKKTYASDAVLTAMIDEWPCLKSKNGHRLIEIDFMYLYPESNLKLFEKWDSFQIKATKIMEDDVGLSADLKIQLKEDDENTRDFGLCSLLPHKIRPTSKVVNSDTKKYNKVSIAESFQAFIMHVKNYAEVGETLQNRHKSYNRKGLTCQPIIVSVGTSGAFNDFYVVVDDIKYRFESLKKAIDICFKCFMVLNLAYPKECEQLWLFIQQYFYGIQLSSDKKFSQVATFIKALEE